MTDHDINFPEPGSVPYPWVEIADLDSQLYMQPTSKFAVPLGQAAAINLLHELHEAAKELANRVLANLPERDVQVQITVYDGENLPQLVNAATLDGSWEFCEHGGSQWIQKYTYDPGARVTIFYRRGNE